MAGAGSISAGLSWPRPPGGGRDRALVWTGCPGDMAPAAVTLLTAVKSVPVSCSDISPPAYPGVLIATGPLLASGLFTQQVPRGSPCVRLHGLRACYSRPIYGGR